MTAKIIFMGTPEFAATILKGLIEADDYDVIAVVTQPDRPVGRKRLLTPSPVKQVAMDHHIEVYQPETIKGSDEAERLKQLGADLIVTAAYGQFVPTRLLDTPQFGAINVHASLLPKYRGGAPIHYAIWQGEEETGISLIYMTQQMDAGDILAQAKTSISPQDDTGALFERLANIGRDLLLDTLPAVFDQKIEARPQNQDEVTFSPTLSRDQEQINWQQTAQQIDRHIRAFRPFPSTYTYLEGQRVKIWAGQPIKGVSTKQVMPGTIVDVTDQAIVVEAGNHTQFAIIEWQQSGKKRMPVADFLNGAQANQLIGKTFEWVEQ